MLDGRLFLLCRRLTLLGGILVMVGIGGCASTALNPKKSIQLNAMLSVSSSSLSFGSVAIGNSTAQLVSLTNTGTAALSIANVSTSGTGFSTSAGSNIIAHSRPIAYRFREFCSGCARGCYGKSSESPATLQTPWANTLVWYRNDRRSFHSVAISWSPSTSNVVGYNVYRSRCPAVRTLS